MDGNEAQLAKIKDAIKKGELTKEIIERLTIKSQPLK